MASPIEGSGCQRREHMGAGAALSIVFRRGSYYVVVGGGCWGPERAHLCRATAEPVEPSDLADLVVEVKCGHVGRGKSLGPAQQL